MSERPDPHAPSAAGDQGQPAAHGDGDAHPGGQGDEHGGEPLGPIDVTAWGALVLGIALGLVVFLAFVYAVS